MNRKNSAGVFPPRLVEALESRIAPAVILAGPEKVNVNGQDVAIGGMQYDSTSTSFKLASTLPIEAGDPTLNFGSSHFYLDLKAGDILRIYNQSSGFSGDFAKITKGRAYAIFFDKNGDFIPQAEELTGLVLSAGTKMTINGSVDGDILATLNGKTGFVSTNDLISNKQSIGALTIGGNVTGSIVAGGNLASISVGQVTQIQSGTPTGALAFDFGGTGAGAGVGEGVIAAFDPGLKQAGGSLINIKVGAANGIYAGNGGAAGGGGSIAGLTVTNDSDGVVIAAGSGGAGSAVKVSGGVGGKVSNVIFFGVGDNSNNDLISISGGAGGDAFAGSAGSGGAGGGLSKVWVGYEYNSAKKIIESPNFLKDEIVIAGGNGGDGVKAGNGGSVSNVYIAASPTEDGGDAEISILGGNGGDLFAAGAKAGAGGSIRTFKIKNLDPDSGGISDVLVQAGDASSSNLMSPTSGKGAAGGSIINPHPKASEEWLIGQSFLFKAGDGSDTTAKGGTGGSIFNLQFNNFPGVLLEELTLNAGAGGDSTSGAGAGGNISGIFAPIAEMNLFKMNSMPGAGDGGISSGIGKKSIGGRGGYINDVQIFDTDTSSVLDVTGSAGAGGDGYAGGGAGGGISNFSFFGQYASLALAGGNGGVVTGVKGKGGAGGSITGIAFSSMSSQAGIQSVTLTAGYGGDGASAGGLGGGITKTNVQTMDSVVLTAGHGGSVGEKGKTGAGGSLGNLKKAALGILGQSQRGSVTFAAGDAGGSLMGTPSKGAAGGSVSNTIALAFTDISFTAGNGSVGGNGGSIAKIGFYGSYGIDYAPSGQVSVIAGNGGAAISAGGKAGRGGSITTATGATSMDVSASVQFVAGTGGSGGKGGAGGSFNGLTITRGNAEFSVVAGDGGDGVVSGGAGGSVSNISVTQDIIIRAIAAGNGGDTAKGKGATGGSVTNVNVAGDIGFRSGLNYGFATDGTKMGGIFAGTAGVNTTTQIAGKAGNVISITAKAIAAIVAGRDASPQLVYRVDGIFLRGNVAPAVDAMGAFTNLDVANFVGGKAGDPSLANAEEFHFVGGGVFTPSGTAFSPWTLGTTQPLDGLIAALTLTSNRNFTPLAFLTNTAGPKETPVYGLYVPTVALA